MAIADGWSLYKPPKPRRPRAPRPKPPPRQIVHDPFAPISDAQLQATARTQATAQQTALLDALRQAIEARSASGTAAIGGLTQQLGNLFSQALPQTQAAYGEAIGRQSALNSELANRLGTFGQGQQAEVGNKLAYAGPSGENVAANVGTNFQGAANAGFAKGAANTEMLNAHSAAAQAYAAKMPGIAGLTGIQEQKRLQAQLSQEFATQAGQITAKAQDIFQTIYQNELDHEWQKTLARQSGQFKSAELQQRAMDQARALAFKKSVQRWQQSKAAADRKLKAQQAAETARHHQATERTAAQSAAERARANRAREANARARLKASGNTAKKKKSKSKSGANDGLG